jgi:signal transduction histidine kinase
MTILLFLVSIHALHNLHPGPDTTPLTTFRKAIRCVSNTNPITPNTLSKIGAFVCESYSSQTAHLANETKAAFESPGLTLAKESAAFKELKSLGWATPESLHRRRPTGNSAALAEFLQIHQLGALLCIPANSPEPSLVLGIGVRHSEDPFTYAEILQLQQAGDLIEYTLIRSRLAAQAELTERMERLAVVSRGLAHDLKNLITPLATFLNHTRDSHQKSGDVHGSASRALGVITDYIDDALFFTDKRQLRLVATDVTNLLGNVSAIVADRARKRHVRLVVNAASGPAAPADATLLQRLLSNLVNNSIDASSPGTTVTLSGTSVPNGGFMFEVTDQGCGIPAENLSRIFEPYFTTKVYGESSRGFGLGLTICQKIAELHHGSISVTSQVGRGTEMRVHLPGLAMAA